MFLKRKLLLLPKAIKTGVDVAEISKRQLSFTRVICLYTDAVKPQLAISV